MNTTSFGTRWAGCAVQRHTQTDSTNTRGRAWLAQGAPHGALVIADAQTEGRGRLSRAWLSQPGGLYLSLLLHPAFPARFAPRIVFAAALAMAQALDTACNVKALVKWPNDILVNGRKICGILLENTVDGLIVGLGLNVNQCDGLDALNNPATSLALLLGREIDANAVLTAFLQFFEARYAQCDEDFPALLGVLQMVSATLGRTVRVLPAREDGDAQPYTARAVNFGEEGELIVEVDGQLHAVYAGDVSVRGLSSDQPLM